MTARILSQGTTGLADPTTGLDLATGHVVGVFQSQLAWNRLDRSLSVFDETTRGAVVLGGVRFTEVTAARLAAAEYGRGAANPTLSSPDLPAGRVLAVHLAARDFAKVTVVRYGADGDIELRWVTYRTG